MIEFDNIEHGERIALHIPRAYRPGFDHVISRTSDRTGELLGGVLLGDFTGSMLFIHQAGFHPNWISPDLLWVVFDYAFNQVKAVKLCGTVPSGNQELLALNEKLGFKVESRIADGYPGGNDLVAMTMTPDECRWLKLKPRKMRAGDV
jgi:hypothetical protein